MNNSCGSCGGLGGLFCGTNNWIWILIIIIILLGGCNGGCGCNDRCC